MLLRGCGKIDNAADDEHQLVCGNCNTPIENGAEYRYNGKILCEGCCITVRWPRVRKTHWQYIPSVKTGYILRDASDTPEG